MPMPSTSSFLIKEEQTGEGKRFLSPLLLFKMLCNMVY
jgi:hypothetical protein